MRTGQGNRILELLSVQMLHAEIYHGYDANDQIIMDILTPNPKDVILEIGVGTGACAKRIAPMIKLYVGIDIAFHTIEALKQRINERNICFCRNLETEIIPPLPRLILSHITTYITPLLIQPLPTSSLPWPR